MAGIHSFPDESGNIMAYQDRGGGGVLNKVLYWEAPTPRSNPLHFYIPFLTEKGTHFEYLLLINGTPFTNLNSLERCIPFNCCEWLSLKHEKNHKASKFLRLFHSHINPSISLFKSVYRLDILQLMKSQPFHIAEAWKRYLFRAEPPCIGHYTEYPHPGDNWPDAFLPTSRFSGHQQNGEWCPCSGKHLAWTSLFWNCI